MAKKQNKTSDESQRQTRKELLQKRKVQEQNRNVYIGSAIVVGLLVILFLVALINEFVVAPNRTVADVSGEEIPISEWEDRVRFERAQRIVYLQDQLEAFGDVGFVQQVSGEVINELLDPELFGQAVKDQMIDDLAMRQAAEARGIMVTEAEVDAWIEESFGFYGGESPPPIPTATATIMPTPSVTPIPTAVITEVVPTLTPFPTVEPGPTQPPAPTPTPKSVDAYQQEFEELMAVYQGYGISEAQYREFVRNQLYREKLAAALAAETDLATAVDQSNFLFLFFEDEAEANDAAAQIGEDGFLQVWNEIRSGIGSDEESTAFASEFPWSDQAAIAQTFGSEVADAALTMDLEEASPVIVQVVDAETNRYFIIYVNGREVRELTEAAYEQSKQEALEALLLQLLSGNLLITDYEEGRAPEQPRLDPIFYTAQPTAPAPVIPEPVEPEN